MIRGHCIRVSSQLLHFKPSPNCSAGTRGVWWRFCQPSQSDENVTGFKTKSNSFSTDAKLSPSPVYELRMYQSLPHNFKPLNDIFNAHMDLRTRHSKLVGFWTAEIGDVIAQVVHLWEYESLSHRLAVRKAIPEDEELIGKYMSKVMPLMTVMKNYLVLPAPDSNLDFNFTNDPNAVWVLQTVNKAYKDAGVQDSKVKDELLFGRLTSVLGPANTEFRLWRYQNIDSVTEASIQRATSSATRGSSLLLYPSPFSPLK